MPLQRSGADFGALQVLQYADGSSFCRGNLAQSLNAADVVRSGSRKKNVKNAARQMSGAAAIQDTQIAAAAATTSAPTING